MQVTNMRNTITIILTIILVLSAALPVFADDSAEALGSELLRKGLVRTAGEEGGSSVLLAADPALAGREFFSLAMGRSEDGAADWDEVFSSLPGWAASLAGTVLSGGLSAAGLEPSFDLLLKGADASRFEEVLAVMGLETEPVFSWSEAEEPPREPSMALLSYTEAEHEPEEQPEEDESLTQAPDPDEDPGVEEIIACAEQYLGVPYRYGGKTPAAFDCSGYVIYVYHECGYEFTAASCQDLYRMSDKVKKADVQRGDLVFFKGTYETDLVSHVGIYLGDGQMIHAGTKGICYTDLSLDYWRSHFYAYGRFSPED